MNKIDKAGVQFWNRAYQGKFRQSLDPNDRSLRAHGRQKWHEYFVRTFSRVRPGTRLLEAGCGGSRRLPYFARSFGFQINGIDYSPAGCEYARAILAEEGVGGEILQGDIFHPPAAWTEAFDVVFSSGLVEHFTDTSACISSLTRFLKPGGLMVTTVPNMCGIVGTIQKLASRRVFETHVALDLPALQLAHQQAGLTNILCEYLEFINFGVVNVDIDSSRNQHIASVAKMAALQGLRTVTASVWLLERLGVPATPNPFTSPYIFCRSVKPHEPATAESKCKEKE